MKSAYRYLWLLALFGLVLFPGNSFARTVNNRQNVQVGAAKKAPQPASDISDSEKALRALIKVPLVRQSTDYTCGIAALQSILEYYGDSFREDVLAKELKSTPSDGTSYKEIVRFARTLGYAVLVENPMGIAHLKKFLNEKKPVLICLQAWADIREKDNREKYKSDWDDGHYVVVVGYDLKNLYFMDPSTLGNYTYIPEGEFLDRWHDVDGNLAKKEHTKLNQFGMVISKPRSIYNPANILKLE